MGMPWAVRALLQPAQQDGEHGEQHGAERGRKQGARDRILHMEAQGGEQVGRGFG
jgi:hypothetical protein